ncbi:TIGR02588 family protein [Rhizobiaceae bacterium CRRU44]|uniref:TIGR02588 family protein n=1 Tax=Ferranicluibacter rubi TaxID=2715133 RepID=A0AA43ZAL7_9HYPH|nr:TIGR02588 family protein [Ferranicluibacter rubi]NHT74230.1 TIGR02588 family protein [Ferranicluibacter rubi]
MARSRRKVVRRHPHWIEWTTGLLSTALVATMTGMILYHGLTAKDAIPELSVTITTQRPTVQGFEVSFIVSNAGKKTAAGVPVTGRLLDGEKQEVETREVTIDYVPAQSQVEGALMFSANPGTYRLDIHASGYSEP